MKHFRLKHFVLLFCSLVILLLAGCQSKPSDAPIKIGAKTFTESFILNELYALALEDQGLQVERIPSIAGSLVPQALKKGEVDLYPEYTGTAFLTIYQQPMETNIDTIIARLKELYAKDNIVPLDYARVNDSAGIVINTKKAEELGIKTIEDLQKHATELRFADPGEFHLRADGLPALAEVYGPFEFKSLTTYDNSLKYQVLRNDEADVASAYTTEAPLVDQAQFTLLEDNKQVWPPYYVLPVVRKEVLDKHPVIAEAINRVNSHLDTETMIKLNAKVDLDGEEYQNVAKSFYESIK